MKCSLIFALAVCQSLFHGIGAQRHLGTMYSCPSATDAGILVDPGLVDIKLAQDTGLCMLALTDSNMTFYPVARSYDQNDWERYLQIGQLSLDVPIMCSGTNANNRRCTMNLPSRHGLQYRLFYTKYTLPSVEDEYARFLEQTTFGPTREDILHLKLSGTFSQVTPEQNMAEWVRHQQEQVPASLHREFFRQRVNSRFESSSDVGQVTHPCQAGGYFRRWAFTIKDKYRAFTIKQINGTTYRELALDGVVYTVVDGPLYNSMGQRLDETQQYQICDIDRDPVEGKMGLQQVGPGSNSCRSVKFNGAYVIPKVFFPTGYVHATTNAPSFIADGYVEPAEQDYYSTVTNQVMLLRITDDTFLDMFCSNIIMASGMAPVVTITYNGAHFISDPRFVLVDNTMESPMPDGGGSIVAETQGFPAEYVTECPNAPRTFLNEGSCKLSSNPDACWSGRLQSNVAGGVVVCGSPGEIANNLDLGGEIGRGAFEIPMLAFPDTTGHETGIDARENVWVYNAIWAPDQLRQRVAWALSQILVLNSAVEGNSDGENWVNFMDIFVRNAFGNYRDILNEVQFSPMMGEMLTFADSNSLASEWMNSGATVIEYPDENFAREILQLFTIGLYQLNIDGTRKIQNGAPIDTYSNDDIMEYAKVFTGFNRQSYRGNSAAMDGNSLDPMTVDPRYRDLFPKMGLNGVYVGDGYPLCANLPDKPFLKKGAKFRIMGTTRQVELGIEIRTSQLSRTDYKEFEADPSGGLYQALCAPAAGNTCTFPAIVELPATVQCKGIECNVDTVGSVLVANGIHYEYIQPPCVQQAFYQNPQKIKRRNWSSTYVSAYMCADPRIAAAGSAMCLNYNSIPQPMSASVRDFFWNERVKWSTMKERGDALKAQDKRYEFCNYPGPFNTKWGMTQFEATPFLWNSDATPCFLKIKINELGKVALIHSMPEEDAFFPNRAIQQWDNNTKSFFRVHWSNTSQAQAKLVKSCVSPCVRNDFDGYCVCNVNVNEVLAFSDPFHTPSRDEVLALKIGSFHPEFLDLAFTTSGPFADGVIVYTVTSTGERIFQATDVIGRVFLRKNLVSTVVVQGDSSLSFRNPPQFMSLSDPTIRDALYENDAFLDHVFYHDNTAPFMALRLAQKFGISNPTPRYVKTIASAFRDGAYMHPTSGQVFGDGAYGNMAATIAATVLDREARTVVLDADPAFGSTKEPILKLMGIMRSLEFQTAPGFPLPRFLRNTMTDVNLQKFIGQAPYMAPSVFGFFLPEFQPDGPIALAGLVSPEAQIHTGDNIIGMVNALTAMIKYGLDRCHGGIGQTKNWVSSSNYDNCGSRSPGQFVNMSGYFGYNVSAGADVVDELATLLTAGRLSPLNRATVRSVIASEPNPQYAMIKAQELIVASSEFHTIGVVKKTGANRPAIPTPTASSRPYKAVVMVMLSGGCDTYNMIVPHTCTGGSPLTVDKQYNTVRDTVALTVGERLVIDVEAAEGQPCSQFGIHNQLPLVKELYDNDELSFFMNVGVLNEPVNKDDYEAKTVTKLFAHNHMQREIQAVDPYDKAIRTGILGRMTQYLNKNGFKAFSLAINQLSYAVYGDVTDKVNSPSATVTDDRGPRRFNEKPSTETYDPLPNIQKMNGMNTLSSSVFGETYSDAFVRAIQANGLLADAIDEIVLPYGTCGLGGESLTFVRGLNMITSLMQTRNKRGSDRDMFYIELGGWDHHHSLKKSQSSEFASLNDALACYTQNMKALGLWNNATLVVASDFGRTMTPNSQSGTDHGWAGHYFAMGGALKKGLGRFFGTYPSDITENGPLNTGRGRLIPTLAFESMWRPIAEWLGIPVSDILTSVLPNANYTGAKLFNRSQVFA